MRLQQYLAQAGIASRRRCEDMIREGRVRVNGQVAVLGQRVEPEDRVDVGGVRVEASPDRVYLLLNKPAGTVTTVSDPQGRPTVMDLVPAAGARVFPVGRLDRDTEGLLLLTNDGPLAHALLHPSRGVTKVYRARVRGTPGEGTLHKLSQGVDLEEGRTAPCRVRRCPAGWLELELKEGRKRQVRRMLAALGHEVLELRRIRFGPLELGDLKPGESRVLRPDEVSELKDG